MSFKSLLRFYLIAFAVVSTIRIETEAHPLTFNSDICIIDVKNNLGEPQPLLLNSQTDEFRLPKLSDGKIEFSRNETIKLYCSHGFRSPFDGKESIFASCVAGKQFKVDKTVVDFSKFVCNKITEHTIRRTNDSCMDGIIVEIGFQIQSKWLHLMRVCHNETIGATNWVHYKQLPSNRGYQKSLTRVRFSQSNFYQGLKVDELYSRNNQLETCSSILQSKTICNKLINSNGDLFLSRGHLAARSDFILYAHQLATFHYINSAPQWQSFNGGNWAVLEENLKHYIDQQNLNADIYTGTHGILQFDDRKGKSQNLYLSSNTKSKFSQIPVPKIYYKIVVTENMAGIVFVGVNNPHASLEEIKQNYIYCENVISKVNYIPWQENVRKGYMYACSIDEFLKFVPSLATKVPKTNRILLFLVCGILVSAEARTTPVGCLVNINVDLAAPEPLYFYYNTTDYVTTATGTSEFYLDSQQKIELFCSDSFRDPYEGDTLIATCISGNQFQIENKSGYLADAKCNNYPNHTTRFTDRTCVVGKIVEIGFEVKGIWLPIMEICHDNKIGSTKWVHHQLKPNNNYHQLYVERILFIQGAFYTGINPFQLYTRIVQRKTIAQILDSEKLAAEIIAEKGDLFLARGHLAAKSDYIFAPHQLATFYYINVAPQWQTFNGGNWLCIERGVRKFIEQLNVDVDVYTGAHDVLTYPDINGKHREIHLSYDSEGSKTNRIPVPRFYYKVLIAETKNAGIVFIGLNDPYASIESIENEYMLCPDVSEKVNYINWSRTNITAGYSYACSVDNFVKVVKELPSLPRVKNLLI
ncbi:uncharacterized protein LOC116339335 [Contarinia nasturtii]|uniref:uncharacterized protein LOC116339335 n=1 Tax=Contarinia nasturtii TaxID=265458 RepID=UPI0012D43F5F|nr:uncharacterized protein LOC116339335 [Contarinia nasturtii]